MKNSFLSGAVILMTANVISKILGAVLKIPLTYIIHEEGMAIYNTAFNVYVMFLSFVTVGTPFAVQKLTAQYHARNNSPMAAEVVYAAGAILAVVGLCGSTALYFGADFFALAMKEEHAGWTIRALSPSIFLVACGAVVKSGFQGRNDMLPTAVSQVIEALVKLGAGYYFALMLLRLGTDRAAAGAAAGVTAGEAVATIILVIWYLISFGKIKRSCGNRRIIIKEITDIALPMLFMSIAGSAIATCDTSVLRASLIKSGLSAAEARFVYGAYTGYAMTVLNLPSGFLATLGVSVVPIISGAAAIGNMERIRAISLKAVGVCAAAGLCSVIGILMFSDEILKLLFHNTSSAPMLRLGAPSVLFICIMQITGAILQSMGCIWRTFASSLAASFIKLGFSAVLAACPGVNIYGAILGSNAAFFVGMFLNIIMLYRELAPSRDAVVMHAAAKLD